MLLTKCQHFVNKINSVNKFVIVVGTLLIYRLSRSKSQITFSMHHCSERSGFDLLVLFSRRSATSGLRRLRRLLSKPLTVLLLNAPWKQNRLKAIEAATLRTAPGNVIENIVSGICTCVSWLSNWDWLPDSNEERISLSTIAAAQKTVKAALKASNLSIGGLGTVVPQYWLLRSYMRFRNDEDLREEFIYT